MEEKPYKYDAFISYRHVEPDMTIAARLHTMLETFTLPKNLRAESNNQRFRVFRDREELSAADLSDSIQEALRSSGHLLVFVIGQIRADDFLMGQPAVHTRRTPVEAGGRHQKKGRCGEQW
jgi:hypothetical protein